MMVNLVRGIEAESPGGELICTHMAFHLIDAFAAAPPKALPTRFGFFGTSLSAKMFPCQQPGITLINSAFDESEFSFLEG